MRLGIDPKVDYAFKKLFGQDHTRPLLIHVLNAILQVKGIQKFHLLDFTAGRK